MTLEAVKLSGGAESAYIYVAGKVSGHVNGRDSGLKLLETRQIAEKPTFDGITENR